MMTLSEQFEVLTNKNDHTGAAIIVARQVKSSIAAAYMMVLNEIEARHELNGEISDNDRKMRDAISQDLVEIARLQGLM